MKLALRGDNSPFCEFVKVEILILRISVTFPKYHFFRINPVGKIPEKAVCRSVFECIFDNMALYNECQINKKALFRTVFWRFCTLGNKRNAKYKTNHLQLYQRRLLASLGVHPLEHKEVGC